MKRILLFLFFISSFATYSQYTLIPDQNFEWFLIRQGYDSGSIDGKVLTSNINTVTKLDFFTGGQNFIASLKGIEDFTALTELSIIDGSLLTSLDVSKNLALTKLICSSNRLSSLDISKNIALTELNCSFNNISSLDITKNTNLKYLSASSNQLTTLELSNCPLLETVQLNNNSLTAINVTNAINLNFLSCGENRLTNLDVTKNTMLSIFACGTNKLSTLDISNNIQLKSFSCEYNDLINLDFTTNTKLEYFRCLNNKLLNLDFSHNPSLHEVHCSNNQLTNIDISKNTNLYSLICNFNDLTNLDTSKNTALNFLNCEYNQITSLDVSKNNNLGLLRCNNNQLISLDLRSSVSWTWWNDYNSWVNNPNLKCINVPNAYFFGYYWNGRKDATASFIDDIPPKFESANQTICSKQNPTISDITVEGYGIKWFNSESNLIELPFNTLLVEGKTYYAMNTAGNCEGPRSSVTISLKTTTIPLAVSPQNLCNIVNPTLANLEITGNNIKWYNSLLGGNSIPITTSLMTGFSYYASQSSNGCESERVSVFVNLLNIVKPSSFSPQTFCIQQNATLNNITITGQNIKWYDALANGTLLSNTTQLQNGITYYASQTINGCESDRTPVLINIQNTPAPTGNTTQTFCTSQNPTLVTIVVSGTAIKWYTSAGALLSNSTTLQDGVTYYASQTENGCESPNKLAVTISLISTLPANDYTELFCDDLNDGSEKVNLSDYNTKLISNTTGYTFSYYSTFSSAENQLAANQITNFSNYKLALGENKIYVRINSNTPCYAIVELKLTLLSKPKITIPDVVPICENNTISIDAGSGFDSYLWSNGATTSSIIVANPGNYFVTVTNNYSTISCSSTKTFEVRKSNIATITSIDTQDWTDNQNTISIFVTGAGDFEYAIDGIHFQDSNQFSNLISGQYTVSVRDKNGCGTATDEVYLLMYPKFFTPNGDGFNDTWKIKFSDIEVGLTVKIFDRYGKFITELQNNIGWNATVNGHELPATDYWFVVIRANGKEYRGHFSLKR
ncbi:T9SS type B sorting domain-containing protein [Flavobacterium sp. 83]|uniref:T9SS type B sorting domain-containing protein n=1 Tax=Flavobacterium sp. 83 TaxID=1131812 RepID=UPI0006917246|nr:T9SS type B sorting domain-containing protein [Flavobacterium sp. 83]